jgi:hemolysin activation/secretion protein
MKKHRACATLLPVALLAFGLPALAQQPPGAGGQLQQIPPAPVLPRGPPEIRIEQRATPPPSGADQAKILVRSLRVTGATLYPEPELIALTAFTPGSELTLAELQQMAARITAHYRSNGYFVAQAYLPAQEIRNNDVTIVVAEGRYGKVDLRNQTPLADRVARDALAGLEPGDAIAFEPLESRLLLLSDLPGVQVRSTLVPGASVGASDLIVDVTPGPRVNGVIEADNAGNRYTGANRIGATVNLNNPLGLGDVASLRVLTSGEGLQYARASYQLQVGRGQVGVAYSHLRYSLGKEFEPLEAHGTAGIASVFGRYPLVRSRNDNLYAQLAFDAKTFRDELDSVPSVTDKKSRVLMASLYGDHSDTLGGGGLSTYSLTLAGGNLDIETPAARAEDALAARTQGHFSKVSFHAMRVQRLGEGPFSVAASINGQLASKNLDVSEKMQLGGMYGVRGYPEGEAYADQGYVASLEGRMDLPAFSALPGRMQLIAFIDHGSVTLNKKPWAAGDNHRTLSAAGVGALWSDPGNFMVRVFYARALGDEPALSAPDKSGRFWIQAAKYF